MSKKEYFYKKKLEVPIYEYDLIIILSNSDSKVSSFMNMDFQDMYASAVQNLFKGTTTHFIILNLDSISKQTYGIIAHESLHIVNMIFNQIGMKHDTTNDETAAYLIEWVYNQILKFIKEKKMINKLKI